MFQDSTPGELTTEQPQAVADSAKVSRSFYLKDVERAHELASRRRKLDEMYRSVEQSARFGHRQEDGDVKLVYGGAHEVTLDRSVAMPLLKRLIGDIDQQLSNIGVRL